MLWLDMSFLETQSSAWDAAHWEFSLVFEDLNDEDLWCRADSRLLSVGEIVSHMVYSLLTYASKLKPEFSSESPLKRDEARYYLNTVDRPFALDMTVAEIASEFERVHKAVKEVFMQDSHSREDKLTFEGPGRTFGEFADYMVFHAAYHTGQAFSVRHLMGHKTNDN